MSLLLAALLGVVIGLVLGATGAGGSVLAVPALVYVLGEGPQEATTASLVIVGVTSVVSAANHARTGHVRWLAGLAFAVVGVLTSIAGTRLNHAVHPDVLLAAFAVLMLVSATTMLLRSRRPADPATGPRRPPRRTAVMVRVVLAGLGVGFLTGFLGVGGGFVVVPALVLALGFTMPVAVGTSLLVVALNSGVALAARTGSAAVFDWAVIVPFTLGAVAASFAGSRVAARVSPTVLTRTFAVLLVAVAAWVLLDALVL
ncbi:sulfite exporter TauE/SafE family protein [uncultured Pseudokineococcus sp.]|uniref:sulfite exporter TauE/SafE family protein n=1 Tax=uncultured Pseudokineococcus sp. TaxID=1642928 RepID=UPI002603734A|nr:sulfite exporter TauE/SafE family protein [uncultured Pseudokineococcus sp.]